MTAKRSFLKRNIDPGQRISFDGGRLYLLFIGKTSGLASIELKRDEGSVVKRTLAYNERLVLDDGRIVLELERHTGRRARFLVSMEATVRLDPRPGTEVDQPATAADQVPQFGGYL